MPMLECPELSHERASWSFWTFDFDENNVSGGFSYGLVLPAGGRGLGLRSP